MTVQLQNNSGYAAIYIFQKKILGYKSELDSIRQKYIIDQETIKVYFAYCVPYTYSRLLKDIQNLPKIYTKKSVLGKSLGGIQIPLLHISDHKINWKQKKNILITGRWHPAQSNSSHTLNGFLTYITSPAREAAQLRSRINFIVVPMGNPDGVIVGNTRTSLVGKDLNRQFLRAVPQLYPQVIYVKHLAAKLQKLGNLFMYLDFHGHSRKKNTFCYGPAYSLTEPNYYKSRIFPKIIQKCDNNFRYHSCSFSIEQQKKQTARATIFQQIGVPFAYTFQTSIGFYYHPDSLSTRPFDLQQWNIIGASIAQGLSKFLLGYEEYETLMKERRANRLRRRPNTPSKYVTTDKFEDDETIPISNKNQPLKIVYNDKTLFTTKDRSIQSNKFINNDRRQIESPQRQERQDKSIFANLIQQLKFPKTTNFIPQIDAEYDSDDHDQDEDLQVAKMKQFQGLITMAVRRQQTFNSKQTQNFTQIQDIINGKKGNKQKIRQQSKNTETQQQMLFLQEIDQTVKPNTTNMRRIKKQVSKNNKEVAILRKSIRERSTLTRKQERPLIKQALNTNNGKSFAQIPNQKISYFGQFKLFSQKSQEDPLPRDKRHSIFKRQTRSSFKPANNIRFSQTYYPFSSNYPASQTKIDQKPRIQQTIPVIAKKSNFQFKFDGIQSSFNCLSKQKQMSYKSGRGMKQAIGPACFWGVRQNIYQKISNKKKSISQNKPL